MCSRSSLQISHSGLSNFGRPWYSDTRPDSTISALTGSCFAIHGWLNHVHDIMPVESPTFASVERMRNPIFFSLALHTRTRTVCSRPNWSCAIGTGSP